MSGYGSQSTTHTPVLSMNLGCSRALTAWYLALFFVALAAVALLDAPNWATVPLAIGGGIWSATGIRRHALRSAPTAIRQIEWTGRWRLTDALGRVIETASSETAWVSRGLVALRFRRADGGRSVSVLVPADAVDRDSHRRLRVGTRSNGRCD